MRPCLHRSVCDVMLGEMQSFHKQVSADFNGEGRQRRATRNLATIFWRYDILPTDEETQILSMIARVDKFLESLLSPFSITSTTTLGGDVHQLTSRSVQPCSPASFEEQLRLQAQRLQMRPQYFRSQTEHLPGQYALLRTRGYSTQTKIVTRWKCRCHYQQHEQNVCGPTTNRAPIKDGRAAACKGFITRRSLIPLSRNLMI